MEKAFKVSGMHCKSCEFLVKEAIEDTGLKLLKVDYTTGIVEVDGDSKLFAKAANAIEKEGYKVVG